MLFRTAAQQLGALVALCLFAGQANALSGRASYYLSGARTANGERFNPLGLTAAHRSLPFGTWLVVHHAGRSVRVRVNDRGPFVAGRVLDLSLGAARVIGMVGRGVAHITYEIVR